VEGPWILTRAGCCCNSTPVDGIKDGSNNRAWVRIFVNDLFREEEVGFGMGGLVSWPNRRIVEIFDTSSMLMEEASYDHGYFHVAAGLRLTFWMLRLLVAGS
jgi:hypothetical protein